jgi:hypothetical protein
MRRRWALLAVLGQIVGGQTAAQAADRHDVRWELGEADEIEAGWCSQTSPEECHTVTCQAGQLHWRVWFDRRPSPKEATPFSFKIDGGNYHRGQLRQIWSSGDKVMYASQNPIPLSFVQALMAGSNMQFVRFGAEVTNTLKNSAASIRSVAAQCGVQLRSPAVQTAAVGSDGNDLAARICAHRGSEFQISTLDTSNPRRLETGFRHPNWPAFVNRTTHNVNTTTHRQGDTLWLHASYRVSGANWGFRLDAPFAGGPISPSGQAERAKIVALVNKFAEWKQTAIDNGLTRFEKQMPDDLRTSVARLPIFRVRTNNGQTTYDVSGLDETGLCWLYYQAQRAEVTIADARNILSALGAEAARENTRQQRLNEQFQ